jgi:hypothetical protein
MPYDVRHRWRLAGDQLAGSTREQRRTTAFLKAGRQGPAARSTKVLRTEL